MASVSAGFLEHWTGDDGYAVIVSLQVSKSGLVTMVKMSLVSLQDCTKIFFQDWTGDDGYTVTWFSPSLQDWTGDDGEDVTCLSPRLDWVTMVIFLQDRTE